MVSPELPRPSYPSWTAAPVRITPPAGSRRPPFLVTQRGRSSQQAVLWVRVWIVYGQPFGHGGGVEALVSGIHGDRPETGLLVKLPDFEGDRQVYGVVSTKPVLACRQHRVIE